MTGLQLRAAQPRDMETVFMMGFDVWRDGLSREEYLAACQISPKFEKGKWWVLETAEGKIMSSLITYSLAKGVVGLGSIATDYEFRKQGFASELIRQVITYLEGSKAVQAFFLFSDIDPTFYEKLGFGVVGRRVPGHPHTVCMVRPDNIRHLYGEDGYSLPSYF